MAETKIEWAHYTFNPWRGCTKVSAGCANCYAETMSGRNPGTLGVWGPNGTRVVAAESYWRQPLKWNREVKAAGERRRVFCASLADVFEDWNGRITSSQGDTVHLGKPWRLDGVFVGVPDIHIGKSVAMMADVRRRLFKLINDTPNLDWLLLTKRPENFRAMLPDRWLDIRWPANVWLGTSVEDQQRADERIPHLLATPAAVRFLSVEPLLGPIEFSNVTRRADCVQQLGKRALSGIDWVIVGGESGHGARPLEVQWVRSIVAQCKAVGVPCFVKQLGAYVVDRNDAGFEAENEVWEEGPYDGLPTDPRAWPTPVDVEHDLDGTIDGYQGAPVRVRLVDKKGGSPDEWPLDLRVREFLTPARTV